MKKLLRIKYNSMDNSHYWSDNFPAEKEFPGYKANIIELSTNDKDWIIGEPAKLYFSKTLQRVIAEVNEDNYINHYILTTVDNIDNRFEQRYKLEDFDGFADLHSNNDLTEWQYYQH